MAVLVLGALGLGLGIYYSRHRRAPATMNWDTKSGTWNGYFNFVGPADSSSYVLWDYSACSDPTNCLGTMQAIAQMSSGQNVTFSTAPKPGDLVMVYASQPPTPTAFTAALPVSFSTISMPSLSAPIVIS